MSRRKSTLWRSLNWPNRISIFRLILIAPFVILVLNQNDPDWRPGGVPWPRYAAFGVFVLMAVSDAVDGILARKLHARTRLGAILDPLADKALIFFSVVLLAIRRFAVPGYQIDNWVVVAVVGKDLWIVAGFLVLYLVTDRFRSHATVFGKAATVGLCVLIPAVLLGPELDALLDGLGTWLMLGLEALVTGLCVLAAVTYTRVGLRFAHEQGKPLDNAPPEPGPGNGPDS